MNECNAWVIWFAMYSLECRWRLLGRYVLLCRSPWRLLLGLLPWCLAFKSSRWNSLGDSAPTCYIVVCLIGVHQIVMAKHGGSCVHFSGISTCGRTSRETVSHPQCPPLPTLCKISLPIYVIVTNKLLQPLTTTWYDSLVLFIPLLKI